MGVRTILCLFDVEESKHYVDLHPDGLAGAYREAGFKVIWHTITLQLQPPYVPEEVLQDALRKLETEEGLTLVHCSWRVSQAGCADKLRGPKRMIFVAGRCEDL